MAVEEWEKKVSTILNLTTSSALLWTDLTPFEPQTELFSQFLRQLFLANVQREIWENFSELVGKVAVRMSIEGKSEQASVVKKT